MKYRSVSIAVLQTLVMFAAGLVIPVLGQVLALFTPVPLILVYVRSGAREGLIALFVSSVIVGILGGWEAGAVLFFSFGLMAVGIAEGMRRGWKPESTALLGGLLPVLSLAVTAVYFFSSIHKNPVSAVEGYLHANLQEAARFYTQTGLNEMAAAIQSVSDPFVHYLVRLLPGIAVATTVFQAACCYGVSRAVLFRKPSLLLQPKTPLALWHAPDAWVWGLIAALTLVALPNEPAKFTGWNLAIIYSVLYLVQGVAILDFYLRRGRLHPLIRGLFLTIILALPTVVFVIALGIVDIWADFRKVRGPAKAEEP